MKTRILFVIVISLGLLTPCLPQEQSSAQMEMIEKLTRPGEFHELLKDFLGTWSTDVKMWMDHKSPPIISKGRITFTLIFDGRYIEGEYLGEFMGAPFMGKSIIGYDNVRKEFFSIWIDNSSTGRLTSTGKYDPGEKKYHFQASTFDPYTGQTLDLREEAYFASRDEYISITYARPKEGEEFKNMEMKYTRIK